jgi:hypothetical protein
MFDYNEQQVSGDEPKADKAESKPEQPGAKDQSSSCGSGRSLSWESCSCGGSEEEFMDEFTGESSTTSADFGYSRPSEPAQSEIVFAEQTGVAGSSAPVAADINAAQRGELWESLVQSQRPQGGASRLPEVAARNAMQWTLVDLTASACDKPGCNPETCDAEDCGTTDAYDRSEYEQPPEYASSGYVPALAFNTDEPAAAPLAYIPTTPEAPKAGAAKGKKAASAKAPKAATAKKAKATKAGGKKAAAKKPAAKKTVKKAGAKKTAKKATTTRAKKSAAAKTSLPLTPPSSDPHFPRVQAA